MIRINNPLKKKKIKYTATVQIVPDPLSTELMIRLRLQNYDFTNVEVKIGSKNITVKFRNKRKLNKEEKKTISAIMRNAYFDNLKSIQSDCVEHKPNG